MQTLEAERAWRTLLCEEDEATAHAAMASCAGQVNIYRRLVHSSFNHSIKRALPLTHALLGDVLDGLVLRFLGSHDITTRRAFEIPITFAQWLAEQHDLPHPATAELALWETLEVAVLLAPSGGVFRMPHSTRLVVFVHPVHTMRAAEPYPAATTLPTAVLCWRSDERLLWRSVSAALVMALTACAEGRSDDEATATAPPELREALREQLVDLTVRGALRPNAT